MHDKGFGSDTKKLKSNNRTGIKKWNDCICRRKSISQFILSLPPCPSQAAILNNKMGKEQSERGKEKKKKKKKKNRHLFVFLHFMKKVMTIRANNPLLVFF